MDHPIAQRVAQTCGRDARDLRRQATEPTIEGACAALETFYHAFNRRSLEVLDAVQSVGRPSFSYGACSSRAQYRTMSSLNIPNSRDRKLSRAGSFEWNSSSAAEPSSTTFPRQVSWHDARRSPLCVRGGRPRPISDAGPSRPQPRDLSHARAGL